MSGAAKSSFDLTMNDGVSGPANTAGQALKQLRSKIDMDVRQIGSMERAMKRLQGGTVQDAASSRRLASELGRLRNIVSTNEAQFVSLGGTFSEVDDSINHFGGSLFDAVEPTADVSSGLGDVAQAAFSTLAPTGALYRVLRVGVGAALGFATAIGGAAVALAGLALASADARRSELLHLEGITTLRNMYGVAAGRASDLQAAIDRVSDASALSRGEVGGMAESLYRAGLRGGQLEDALDGLQIAQAVQGDRGAARFRALATSMRGNSAGIRRLADDYRARLGPIATRMSESLTRQSERLHEAVSAIFDGVQVDGFLHGMRDVVSLFSQSTVTGRALRTLAAGIFSPLFSSVGTGSSGVRDFFEVTTLAALRVGIAVLRVRNSFRQTFGDTHLFAGLDATKVGLDTIDRLAIALTLSAHGVGALASEFRALGAAMAPGLTLAAGWSAAGVHLVDGLVEGISGGFARVQAVVGDLAQTARDALTGALEIHSPSRVFAGLGREVPRGFAEGIESDGGVGPAVESMAAGAAGGVSSAAPSSSGSASPSYVFNLGEITVNVLHGGAEEGRAAARALYDELATLLEGVGISIGAPA